jgi:hypothetical protein
MVCPVSTATGASCWRIDAMKLIRSDPDPALKHGPDRSYHELLA